MILSASPVVLSRYELLFSPVLSRYELLFSPVLSRSLRHIRYVLIMIPLLCFDIQFDIHCLLCLQFRGTSGNRLVPFYTLYRTDTLLALYAFLLAGIILLHLYPVTLVYTYQIDPQQILKYFGGLSKVQIWSFMKKEEKR